ncbi:MAG: hypothetical protein ACT4OE_02610, partial [Sphingosinicella sp.]
MGPTLYVMALLGCGESDAACREIAQLRTHYPSQQACLAATPTVLERNLHLAYPNVVAQCRRAGTRTLALRGSEVMQPAGPNGVRMAAARTWRA